MNQEIDKGIENKSDLLVKKDAISKFVEIQNNYKNTYQVNKINENSNSHNNLNLHDGNSSNSKNKISKILLKQIQDKKEIQNEEQNKCNQKSICLNIKNNSSLNFLKNTEFETLELKNYLNNLSYLEYALKEIRIGKEENLKKIEKLLDLVFSYLDFFRYLKLLKKSNQDD